jgi:hypothetical protein
LLPLLEGDDEDDEAVDSGDDEDAEIEADEIQSLEILLNEKMQELNEKTRDQEEGMDEKYKISRREMKEMNGLEQLVNMLTENT